VAAGGSAEPFAMDATNESDVMRLFDRAMAPGEGLAPADLVVFNAGNNQRIDFRELTARAFEALRRPSRSRRARPGGRPCRKRASGSYCSSMLDVRQATAEEKIVSE